MRDNPVQFAVVREDPAIEFDLVATHNCQRVLLIGSGGCTALSLQARFPTLDVTLVDPNPAQLAHVRRKMKALAETAERDRGQVFGIGPESLSTERQSLNGCGNFESLFRLLREFIEEFILDRRELEAMFANPDTLATSVARLVSHRYWPVGFDLMFSEPLLLSMFGQAAIQHAVPGSYPRYFQRVFEQGLSTPGAARNYFLHHILLGYYRAEPGCLPYYLDHPVPDYRFTFVESLAEDVADFGSYDLVGLSNILDWMDEPAIKRLARNVAATMKPGALLVFRQLNHSKSFEGYFASDASRPTLRFDPVRAERLRGRDRSLFYSRFNVATKLAEAQ